MVSTQSKVGGRRLPFSGDILGELFLKSQRLILQAPRELFQGGEEARREKSWGNVLEAEKGFARVMPSPLSPE